MGGPFVDDCAERGTNPSALMRSIIQRIATGPELSKDISRAEARAGMGALLDGTADPVQAGIFLIALRMKRETDDEVCGVLDAIRAKARIATVPVDELVDIADPYDGYSRSLPAAPFLPALLAACGVPAVSHGVERMGPKFGLTHSQVLAAAGLRVDLSVDEAAARLAEPSVGWAYVDQREYCPTLHALSDLRTRIVKRQAITTVEVLVGPLRARGRTHLVTGFVHKPYPRIYALLAREAGFDSALIVRGIEGGVIPSLRQAGKAFYYRDRGDEQPLDFAPADLGFDRPLRPEPMPGAGEGHEEPFGVLNAAAAAHAAAQAGMAALGGAPGPVRDGLVSAAALVLWQLQRFDTLRAAAAYVQSFLGDAGALARLHAAR